jgi:Chaperone of endosialidase
VHTAFTTYSDGRHKKDIEDSDLGLDFIDKLRPVSYRFNNGDDTLRYGFIAQEVEAALPLTLRDMVEKSKPEHGRSLIVPEHNEEGTYHMTYDDLIASVVKSIQDIKTSGDDERKKEQDDHAADRIDIADLKHLIADQQKQIAGQTAILKLQQNEIEQLQQQLRNPAPAPDSHGEPDNLPAH